MGGQRKETSLNREVEQEENKVFQDMPLHHPSHAGLNTHGTLARRSALKGSVDVWFLLSDSLSAGLTPTPGSQLATRWYLNAASITERLGNVSHDSGCLTLEQPQGTFYPWRFL